MVWMLVLTAGTLGSIWWLARGSRRAQRLYRRWRYRDSIVVYGYGEQGRAWQAHAALAALLALAGPMAPDEIDAARAWRAVRVTVVIVWLVVGALLCWT
jgi:hypothetical protein